MRGGRARGGRAVVTLIVLAAAGDARLERGLAVGPRDAGGRLAHQPFNSSSRLCSGSRSQRNSSCGPTFAPTRRGRPCPGGGRGCVRRSRRDSSHRARAPAVAARSSACAGSAARSFRSCGSLARSKSCGGIAVVVDELPVALRIIRCCAACPPVQAGTVSVQCSENVSSVHGACASRATGKQAAAVRRAAAPGRQRIDHRRGDVDQIDDLRAALAGRQRARASARPAAPSPSPRRACASTTGRARRAGRRGRSCRRPACRRRGLRRRGSRSTSPISTSSR